MDFGLFPQFVSHDSILLYNSSFIAFIFLFILSFQTLLYKINVSIILYSLIIGLNLAVHTGVTLLTIEISKRNQVMHSLNDVI